MFLSDLVALVAFFGSGFLSLTYEIAWIRASTGVFGCDTFALSTVIAVFFGGLALGSHLFGRLSARCERPLWLYGWIEIGVGVLALLTPAGFRLADTIYGAIYADVYASFAQLSGIRLGLVTLLVLPPALLMGGTLPLFCRYFVRSERRISSGVGWLYGWNTLGAAAGCLVCGFVLIPRLGVHASIYWGGVLNLVLGVVVLLLPAARARLAPQGIAASEHGERTRAGGPRTIAGLFFLSGYVALALEVLWTRFLSLLMQNSVYRYTLTLGVVLVGIVIGSWLTSWVFDRVRRRAAVFGTIQMLSGLVVLALLLRDASAWEPWIDPPDLGTQLALMARILLLPAVLSGMAFPLAVRMVVDRAELAGPGVGRMAALNTLGGILGALVTGFLLVPGLGLQRALLVTTGIGVGAGCVALLRLERPVSWTRRGLALAGMAAWIAIPRLSGTELPADLLAPREKLVAFREGLSSHAAVLREGARTQLHIDRLWQGEDRKSHQVMAAHVPMLLHGSAERVLVIGMGPGQTAGRFLMHPIAALDCVELEATLPPLVREHFDSAWMDDPRVRFVIEDGRNFVLHTDQRYDLISIEVGQVFRPGVASFYTLDFYERAAERLEPRGLLAQFLPLGMFQPGELRTVVRSFLDAFEQAVLWYNHEELLLIGSREPIERVPRARLEGLRSREALWEDLDYAYWGSAAVREPAVFLAGYLMGTAGLERLAGDAAPYRDDRPYLEYATALPRELPTVENVKAVRACLGSPEAILAEPMEAELLERVRALRRTNLRDIEARYWDQMADASQRAGDAAMARELRERAVRKNPENTRIRGKL